MSDYCYLKLNTQAPAKVIFVWSKMHQYGKSMTQCSWYTTFYLKRRWTKNEDLIYLAPEALQGTLPMERKGAKAEYTLVEGDTGNHFTSCTSIHNLPL